MTARRSITTAQPATYLVIGANGFVGSHLVDRLAKLPGANVIGFDRYSRPPIFKQQANITSLKGDFFNGQDLEEILENVNYVVHCLSLTTPASSAGDPLLDTQMVKRNADFFESCAKSNVKKIAFVSSADVYGPAGEKKVANENDKPEPASPYGKAKLASEQFLESLLVKNGQDYVVYRLTNPYGPRQTFRNGQGVIPRFIDNVRAGRKIEVWGDGSASRDYIFATDAAKMMIDVLGQPSRHNIYNIGSGEQTTINELIEAMQKHLNQKIAVGYRKTPTPGPRHIRVSTERFISEFGAPKLVALEPGIAKTLAAAELMVAAEQR